MEITIRNPLFESKKSLSLARFGSPRTRHEHETIIRRSIKDFFLCGIAFNSFREVKTHDIQALVDYWKTKSLSDTTIGNRLSALRKYFTLIKNRSDFPSNRGLGLKGKVSHFVNTAIDVAAYYQNLESKFQHPITRLLIELQVWFGVTKLEAIRLSPYAGNADKLSLLLQRSITHNHKDRLIMIYCDKQKEVLAALKSFLKESLSLSEKYKKKLICDLYEAEHLIWGLSEKAPYRQLFARNVFRYLVNDLKLDKTAAVNQISQQMGMTRKTVIRGWIK